jgi:hypothetical protein
MSPGEAPETEAQAYFQAIEERFARLRGAPLVLSPADWQMAAGWRRQGIPLPVVLRALEQVFATAAARGRRKPVLSLSYCRHEVEAEFARWRDAAAGAQGADPAPSRPPADRRLEAKAERLARCSADWPEPLQKLAAEARGLLTDAAEEIRSGAEPAALEERLARDERKLLERLRTALAPAERAELEAACETRLEPYRSRMIADEYHRTLRHAVDDALRRHLGLPRLSLLSD